MSEINLLQNTQSQIGKKSGFGRTLNIIGIFLLVFIVVASVVIYLLTNKVQSNISSVDVEQNAEQTKIEQINRYPDLITTQKTVKDLKGLLTNRLDWPNALPNLGAATLNTIYYSGVTLNNNGSATILGVSPNFKELYRYITVLQSKPYSDYIKDIKILSTGLDDLGKIDFTISLNFDKQFWTANPNSAVTNLQSTNQTQQ